MSLQPRRSGFLIKAVLLLVLLAVAGVGTGLYLITRGSHSGALTEVVIPRGASQAAVAERLFKEGVIEHPKLFKLLLRVSGGASKVRAGEFRFRKGMGLFDALFVLYHDTPILHTVTIPEGWNARLIAAAYATANLGSKETFLKLMLSPESPKKYGIEAPTLEGFLFPSTYSFSKVDGEERIVDAMVKEFFKNFGPELQNEAKNLGFTLNQIVTLASIIEKETGVGGERQLVSSVFHNRLKKRMRLQSDPTIIYGIDNFDGDIRSKDIRREHPYNTYVIPALPPGPIASPGAAALLAALRPAQTNYLYFVANNRGEHVFSETYGQHLRHVNNYQRGGRGAQPSESDRKPQNAAKESGKANRKPAARSTKGKRPRR